MPVVHHVAPNLGRQTRLMVTIRAGKTDMFDDNNQVRRVRLVRGEGLGVST